MDQFIKDVKKGKMTFSPMLNGLMRSAIIEWQPKKIGKRLNVVKSKAKHLLCNLKIKSLFVCSTFKQNWYIVVKQTRHVIKQFSETFSWPRSELLVAMLLVTPR